MRSSARDDHCRARTTRGQPRMISLVVAALVWVLIHVLISGGPLRPWLADRLGQKVYRALFALLSIASLAALFASYLAVKPVTPADTPSWLAAGLSAVQLLAMLLVVAGLSTVNPTTAGFRSPPTSVLSASSLAVPEDEDAIGCFQYVLSTSIFQLRPQTKRQSRENHD